MVEELRRRTDEHWASMKYKGLERERLWLQETPQGSMVILYMEGEDPTSNMAKVFESESDFDGWFAGELKAIHGTDPNQPPLRMERDRPLPLGNSSPSSSSSVVEAGIQVSLFVVMASVTCRWAI